MFNPIRGIMSGCTLAVIAVLATTPASAVPIQNLLNLDSVTIFEGSSPGGADLFTFGATSTEMTTRRAGLLDGTNRDFQTVAGEFYDVFYSNADGTVNPFGEFVSVEAIYTDPFNFGGGGGHNVSAVRLNFSVGGPEFADSVSSFLSFGLGSFPGTADNAVDGDIGNFTFLGQTSDETRLRVTVGFASSVSQSVPEPGTLAILGIGLAGICIARRRRAAQ